VPTGGIPFVSTKARFWAAGVQRHGGSLTQAGPGLSCHAVLAEQAGSLSASKRSALLRAAVCRVALAGVLNQRRQTTGAIGPFGGPILCILCCRVALQDPKSPGITHVVVGDRGIASLPPQLQPGSSQPARSSSSPVGQPAPLPASKATATALAAEPQRHWVSSQWVEQCLAQQQLLPTEDFPPPDPDAVQVTPTAAGELRHACSACTACFNAHSAAKGQRHHPPLPGSRTANLYLMLHTYQLAVSPPAPCRETCLPHQRKPGQRRSLTQQHSRAYWGGPEAQPVAGAAAVAPGLRQHELE
jgi:hypothetical protein